MFFPLTALHLGKKKKKEHSYRDKKEVFFQGTAEVPLVSSS